MNYWLVKSKFIKDATELFIQNDLWKNFDNKHFDTVKRVEEGDILLLGDESLISYYAICVENENDGKLLLVDEWKRFQKSINFSTKKTFSKIIVKINDIELIKKVRLAIEEQKGIDSLIIKSIDLKNFTLFQGCSLEFSSGINIIIGENSTGKTQLLKLLYTLIQSNNELVIHCDYDMWSEGIFKGNNYNSMIENYLKSILKPNSIQNLITKGKTSSDISLNLKKYKIIFSILAQEPYMSTVTSTTKYYNKEALFLPAKETLSFYTGFRSIYNQTSFDATYDDLANHLGKLVPKNRYFEQFEKNILERLEEILGGEIILENDRFYLLEKDGNKREISLVAEGLRKLGTIFHLLANGTIEKGSVIFWDEPESNLNPKLIAMIVDMLIILSENGIQIFIATHNYFLIKYFDIRKKEKKSMGLKFISFFKENGQVKSETATDIYDLEHNSIIDEMENIYLESSKLFYKGNE